MARARARDKRRAVEQEDEIVVRFVASAVVGERADEEYFSGAMQTSLDRCRTPIRSPNHPHFLVAVDEVDEPYARARSLTGLLSSHPSVLDSLASHSAREDLALGPPRSLLSMAARRNRQ